VGLFVPAEGIGDFMTDEIPGNANAADVKDAKCGGLWAVPLCFLTLLVGLISGVYLGHADTPSGQRNVAVAKSLTIWPVAVCNFDASPVKINDWVGISPSDESRCTSLGPNPSSKSVGMVIREYNKSTNSWEITLDSPHW
jgi:hypothetical protein